MRVLLALGGNAMTAPDGSSSPADQIAAVESAAAQILTLIEADHQVVVTHGNGPQVGDLLRQNEITAHELPPMPLDWCVAQTQGTIGFILMDALHNVLRSTGRPVYPTAVLTRVLVDQTDPGFHKPTKPIGGYRSAHEARLMMEYGQDWEDRGVRGWRRVVASPEPLEILDAPAINAMVEAGLLVIASGGGGIPVVRELDGSLRGIEAVIDKDRSAVLLAGAVHADVLVIATDVPNAMINYGKPNEEALETITAPALRLYAQEGHFASGSMGPKIEAACRFVESGGARAVITALDKIGDAVLGHAGTVVLPG